MEIVLGEWYRIPRSRFKRAELDQLTKKLTVHSTQRNYVTKEERKPEPAYFLSPDLVHVPPYFGIETFGPPIFDERHDGEDRPGMRFVGDLEEELRKQQSAFRTVLAALTRQPLGSATLSLPPGDGKTRVAVALSCEIKKKTLVLVHKDPLVNQWCEAIKELVPDAKIGTLVGQHVDHEGKDFVICMIQSLIKGKYPRSLLDTIGLLIIDECHHISATEFKKSLLYVYPKRVLALSGTPSREDGMDKLLSLFIGPVTFCTRRTYTTKVLVRAHHLAYDPLPLRVNRRGDPDRPKMIGELVGCSARNASIVDVLCDLYPLGRQMIVLSDRRNHLEILRDLILQRIPDASVGILWGNKSGSRSKKGKEKAAEEFKQVVASGIILTTFQMSSEGIDIPSLSIGVVACPKGNVQQAVARILRDKHPQHQPLICDFVEGVSIWDRSWYKRKRFYASEGFEVKHIGNKRKGRSGNNSPDSEEEPEIPSTKKNTKKPRCVF